MEYGIRHIFACGIRNPENSAQGFGNPSSTYKQESGIQCLEPGIPNVEFRIQDCLGLPSMGRSGLTVDLKLFNVESAFFLKISVCWEDKIVKIAILYQYIIYFFRRISFQLTSRKWSWAADWLTTKNDCLFGRIPTADRGAGSPQYSSKDNRGSDPRLSHYFSLCRQCFGLCHCLQKRSSPRDSIHVNHKFSSEWYSDGHRLHAYFLTCTNFWQMAI